MSLDAKIPEGAIGEKWSKYKSSVSLINPTNKRSLEIIVVGSGLAIKTMVIVYIVYFMIPSKVEITGPEKAMYIDSLKSVAI